MFVNKHKNNTSKIKQEKRPPKKITQSYLHNSGLYYLERFAASKNHFKTVMLRKIKNSCRFHEDQDYAACVEMLDKVIESFVRSGLLNDDVYAKGLAQTLRRRGQSGKASIQKMNIKGIDSTLAANSLREIDKDIDDPEFQAALRLTQRKRIGYYAAAPHDDLKKPLGMLARAGFSYEISMRALNYNPEATDIF